LRAIPQGVPTGLAAILLVGNEPVIVVRVVWIGAGPVFESELVRGTVILSATASRLQVSVKAIVISLWFRTLRVGRSAKELRTTRARKGPAEPGFVRLAR
jgi:hypothetical protein